MPINVTALREEFAGAHSTTSAIIEKADAEKRELTPEEAAANDAAFARMEVIKKTLDQNKKLAELAFVRADVQTPQPQPGQAEHEENFERGQIVVGDTYEGGLKLTGSTFAAFKRSVSLWMRTGQPIDPRFSGVIEGGGEQIGIPKFMAGTLARLARQRFAASTITGSTQGGAFLPVDVDQPLVATAMNAFRQAHAELGVDVLKTQNTAKISMPVLDANAGGVIAENATIGTVGNNDNPPTVSQSISLPVSTYQSGETWYSNQELNAVDFDLFSATLPVLEYGKELGLESAIVAAMIADSNITQTTATATTSTLSFPNMVSLTEALPKRYAQKRFILLSQTAHALYAGLVTSTGQPIITFPDTQGVRPLNFQGIPVYRSDYLSAMGANAIVGACISLLGFRLRDCAGETVARYTQFPGRPSQTGYNLFSFHGYGYAPSAVSLLKCPAS